MPEHQRVQKQSQKIQSIQDKRKICKKKRQYRSRRVRKLKHKEERHLLLSNKIHKNKMQDAEVVAELQRLQAGEERRGGNASQTGGCRLEALWQQIAAVYPAVGPNQVDALASAVFQRFKESGATQEQMPGRDERRRNGEDEQEQGRINQQLVLPTPGGINQGAPASSLELDLPRARGAPGEGGNAGRSGTQGVRKRGPSRSPGRHSTDEDGDDDLGEVVLQTEMKEKQPGKGPKNL